MRVTFKRNSQRFCFLLEFVVVRYVEVEMHSSHIMTVMMTSIGVCDYLHILLKVIAVYTVSLSLSLSLALQKYIIISLDLNTNDSYLN